MIILLQKVIKYNQCHLLGKLNDRSCNSIDPFLTDRCVHEKTSIDRTIQFVDFTLKYVCYKMSVYDR